MKRQLLLLSALFLFAFSLSSQKSTDVYYFDEPVMIDSNSTVIIPKRYNTSLWSSSKISWDCYANIIFYDFTTDTYKNLFETNTYITEFSGRYKYRYDSKQKNSTSNYFFCLVKPHDRNKNDRIDSGDPSVLYVSDLHGNNLKALTSRDENVRSFEIYENQNFVLVKIQRDQDKDWDFESDDTDYYYVKLDLKTMTLGNKIEIK